MLMLIEEQGREMEDAVALTLEAAAARGLTEAPGLPSSSQRGPSSREHDGPPQPLQPQPPQPQPPQQQPRGGNGAGGTSQLQEIQLTSVNVEVEGVDVRASI